jgi:hypothetical protein
VTLKKVRRMFALMLLVGLISPIDDDDDDDDNDDD